MGKYAESMVQLIQESQEHLTAEKIFLEMKKIYPKIVLATVYNNLNRLCQEGRIQRVSLEGMTDCYDKAKRHDHVICQQCGKIQDICFSDLTEILRQQLGMEILSYQLQVSYFCPSCRSKKSEGEESEPIK